MYTPTTAVVQQCWCLISAAGLLKPESLCISRLFVATSTLYLVNPCSLLSTDHILVNLVRSNNSCCLTVLTPHIGSRTVDTRIAMYVLAARNILNALTGQHLLTPVNWLLSCKSCTIQHQLLFNNVTPHIGSRTFDSMTPESPSRSWLLMTSSMLSPVNSCSLQSTDYFLRKSVKILNFNLNYSNCIVLYSKSLYGIL